MNYRKYVFDDINFVRQQWREIESLTDDELAPIIEARIEKLKTYYKIRGNAYKKLRQIFTADLYLNIWLKIYICRPGDMSEDLRILFQKEILLYEDYSDDE